MPATYVYQYANNAAGQLLAGITAVSTSCTLQSGQGSNFPTADHDGGAGATAFKVTLIKSTGEREICLCERTAGSDVLTFVDPTTGAASVNGRAQESTSALVFDANDQVELRLTKGQVESFEEDIDDLETTVTAIAADYLDSDHLPGGANEDDHDDRYYTESEVWTRAELAAAGGGAPVDAEHLTGKDAIAHSEITDDEATKHRLINDSAGNGDTTELWSANKIYDQLALKSSSTHSHPNLTYVQHYMELDYGNFTGAGGLLSWDRSNALSALSLTGSLSTFGVFEPPGSCVLKLDSNINRMRWTVLYGAYDRNCTARVRIFDLPALNAANGTTRDTGASRTLSYDNNDPLIYESAAETISIPDDDLYQIWFEMITTDPTPGRFGIGGVLLEFYDSSVGII